MILVSATRDWQSPPVRIARSALDRLRGLRPRPGEEGLLIRTRAVHSFGMREALWLVDVAEDGCPVRSVLLLPQRMQLRTRSGWILELPGGWPPPPLHAPLRFMPAAAG